MSLDKIFEEAVTSRQVPGIAAIALDKTGKILYRSSFGSININDPHAPKVTSETPFLLWSCTKLITCVAALQLLEQGKLPLDDPVEKHVPAVKEIKILEGFDEAGKPKLREPKVTMKVRHLMTHTAGFTYDFFDEGTLKYRSAMGQTPATILATGAWHEFATPLAHEPGERYTYGVNIDWLGFCIESISGLRLEEYIKQNILQPLGMNDTGSHLRQDQKDNFMLCHMKDQAGTLTPNLDLKSPEKPDKFGGGHYMIGTIDNYAKFLLTILNNGTHPTTGVKILSSETVSKYIFTDHLSTITSTSPVGMIPSTIPQVSRTGEFLPGVKKTWSLGCMLSEEDVKTGRKKGSGAWAGLGNNYFWIDREEGKLGIVLSAILPFFDEGVLRCFDALERWVYGHNVEAKQEEEGNYRLDKLSA